jgi:hypothetical protein
MRHSKADPFASRVTESVPLDEHGSIGTRAIATRILAVGGPDRGGGRRNPAPRLLVCFCQANSVSSALASFRSSVSKPSVNQS